MLDELLELVANRVLALDPATRARLDALAGRSVCLHLAGTDLYRCVTAGSSGLTVLPEAPEQPDATLHAPVQAVIQLLAGSLEPGQLGRHGIRVEGDVELAREFTRLMTELDIDWEELASAWVGDVAAHRLGEAARGLGRTLRAGGESVRADVAEYLQEEARVLASRPRVEAFIVEVDRLRADTDRLEKRLERLRARIG